MACITVHEFNISNAHDTVTMQPYVTIRPNPETEKTVYAVSPAFAVELAQAILAAVKRAQH